MTMIKLTHSTDLLCGCFNVTRSGENTYIISVVLSSTSTMDESLPLSVLMATAVGVLLPFVFRKALYMIPNSPVQFFKKAPNNA